MKLRQLLASGTVVALLGLLLLGCSGGSIHSPLPSIKSDQSSAAQPLSGDKAKRGTFVHGDGIFPTFDP